VITGEGHADSQTLAGKGPAEVAHRAAAAGCPVLLVAGRISISRDEANSLGVTVMQAIEHIEADPDRQNEQAARLLRQITVLALRRYIREALEAGDH
jgi:glycerate kinase